MINVFERSLFFIETLVPKRVKPLFISSRYCTKMDTLRVQKASADAILPYRATKGAAGYDLSRYYFITNNWPFNNLSCKISFIFG